MDLSYTPEQEAFRQSVRTWLQANVPPRDPDAVVGDDASPERLQRLKAWQRKVCDAGYLALGWPKEYGGQGMDVIQQTIVNEEMVLAKAPALIGMMGIQMVGPTLIQHGSEAQRRRFLPKILAADEIWCQGYSEPGSGSDLASLRTRAELVGDEFVVNGQKVWTSNAHFADYMFCLVRTDPDAPKHLGISYILIDMRSPGLSVRPLVQMTGDPGFNEVFFENVRVPRENLVGTLHQGWLVANSTLAHERNMLGSTTRTQQMFDTLVGVARRCERQGRPAAQDPLVRQRLAGLKIRVEALKAFSYRQLTDRLHGRSSPMGASINKLASTELNHDICAAAIEILGCEGQLLRGDARVHDRGMWPQELMFTIGMIIGGGTSEIQKNILATRGLGLPKSS